MKVDSSKKTGSLEIILDLKNLRKSVFYKLLFLIFHSQKQEYIGFNIAPLKNNLKMNTLIDKLTFLINEK